MRFRHFGRVALLLTLATPMASCAQAPTANSPATQPAPTIDASAITALKQMGATLAAAQSFSFKVNDSMDQFLDNGQRVQLGRHMTVQVRRPDHVAAETIGDAQSSLFFFDGKQVVLFNRLKNSYAIQDAPGTIDAMFDFLATRFGVTAPLSDFLFSDPASAVDYRVTSAIDLGLHEEAGHLCHHLAFREDGVDFQLWLDNDQKMLPRKVVIDYLLRPGQPQFVAYLDDWNLSADIPDSAFTFTPPPDAARHDLVPTTQPAVTPAPSPSK
jgi:hypothetical protein